MANQLPVRLFYQLKNAKKSIAYCYPTSPQAGKMGFGKSGCYYIQINYINKAGRHAYKVSSFGFLDIKSPELLRQFEAIDLPACQHWQKSTLNPKNR